jgi:hypothetical protein
MAETCGFPTDVIVSARQGLTFPRFHRPLPNYLKAQKVVIREMPQLVVSSAGTSDIKIQDCIVIPTIEQNLTVRHQPSIESSKGRK